MDVEQLYEQHREKLDIFSRLLSSANKRVNLMSREEISHISSHILDSLLLAEEIHDMNSIIDLGSGGGFPLIPLAIVCPDISFTGIDSAQRKTDFLEMCKVKLSLSNVQILHSSIEESAHLHAQFDGVTARALAPLHSLLSLATPFLKNNTSSRLIFLKGTHWKSEVAAASGIMTELGVQHNSTVEFSNIPGREHSAVLTFSRKSYS